MLRIVFVSLLFVGALAMPQVQPAQFPAGVDPEACPGFPFCATNGAALNANPLVRQGPADVNVGATVCANFPFCDLNGAHNPTIAALGFPAGVDPRKCPGFPFQPCL